MASPKNALILYNYYCNTRTDSIQHIDRLAKYGCSGRIHLEEDYEGQQGSSRLKDIIQLLGLSGCRTSAEMKQTLMDRFGKMRLGIISSSLEVIEMVKSAGLTWTKLWDLQTGYSGLDILIQSGNDDMDNSLLDCLIVDMTYDQDSRLAWHWTDQVVGGVIDSKPSLLKCVVTKFSGEQQQQQTQTAWWNDLVPPQSYEFKNGVRIKSQLGQKYVCAYLHAETTRADTVDTFDVNKMDQLGCNGSILAWHYLAEIGHKLGYVPKYGA